MSNKLKKPPTRIDEHDRLTVSLSAERAVRLKLQHEAAVKHANEIAAQGHAHGEKHKLEVANLYKRYALNEADTIDLETGTITRAQPPAKTEAPKKEG